MDLHQLHTLSAVIDSGSFEAAARTLNVTPSAVSQRIKALEQRAGRVLVQRSKPARLTDAGAVVLRLARQLALLESEADSALGGATITNLAIGVNADSLDTWVLPALRTVEGVTFDIHREDQEHSVDLLREGRVMGAVTSDSTPVQGCTVRRLGSMRYRPMAAPGWPTQIATTPVVVFDRKDDLQDAFLRSRGVDPLTVPRHYVPGSSAFVTAVVLGFGWGMLPDEQAAEHLAAGRLALIDETAAVEVPLYWQQWALDSDALERTAEALATAFAS